MPEKKLTRDVPAEEVDRALLDGDPHAFEELVRRESPRLFRMLARMLRDEDEAESVLQETFLQAYQRLGSFRGEAKVSTWLYAIALNQARAALRKRRRLTTLEEADVERLQPSFQRGMFTEQFDTWSPQKIAERSELQAIVRRAIDRLPEDYRTIVMLRDIEQLSTAEAAALLDISEGAARVRLHRARQALRSILDEHLR